MKKQLPPEIWKWNAIDVSKAIRHGAISSRDAVTSSLQRMAQVNPKLNAVVADLGDKALVAASAADAAVARGDVLGPLHGVPVTIKVNVDQQGEATTNGVVAFANNIATEDSPVVANFRRAGAIVIGRTNTPAFSMRWVTDNALHGTTLNPWSRAHTPGGSSGGASASVAAGISAIAHGNDLAGSVRYPAYCTGIFGLRPSFGRVPAFMPSAKIERALSGQLMSVQGPLARCVEDLRLALTAMAMGDSRDPWWVPAPLIGEPLPRPIRVALSVNPSGTGVHPDVEAAVLFAGRLLADAGYSVEAADPPDMAAIMEDWHVLSKGEAPHFLTETVHAHGDEGIRQSLSWHLERPPKVDAVQYMEALARRTTWIRRWNDFMRRYPLILSPVSLAPPFKQGEDIASEAGFDEIVRTMAPCFAIPVLGLPSLAVPTGIVGGLPMGVQITGPRFREDLVLEAGEAIEARVDMITPIDPTW